MFKKKKKKAKAEFSEKGMYFHGLVGNTDDVLLIVICSFHLQE